MDIVSNRCAVMGIVVCGSGKSVADQLETGGLRNCGDFCRGQGRGLRTVTEDLNVLAPSDCDLAEQGKEVVGDSERVFSHDSSRVGSGGVEVAEESAVPAWVGFAVVLDNCFLSALSSVPQIKCSEERTRTHFNHHLSPSVRVRRSNGTVFRNRNHSLVLCSVSVDGRRRGEDNILHIVFLHCVNKRDSSADIDAVVFRWDF
jgi:hypothetical protein